MKVTIIQDDGRVGVDGDFREVDVSELAGEIRAVHFDTVLGVGMVEFDPGVTVLVNARDFEAERIEYDACGDDREKLAALQPIVRQVPVRRAPERINDFTPYQVYVERWQAAAPAAPAPGPEQGPELERETKRSAALRALDDERLAAALLDPLAPQAVKDYAAVLEVIELPAEPA